METFSSLVALLARRAEAQPEERAYLFLSDRGEEEGLDEGLQRQQRNGSLDAVESRFGEDSAENGA